jgi:hypothetical protein
MQTVFELTYKVDNTLMMSSNRLKVTYATDIDFQGLAGQKLTDDTVEQKIKTEQVKIENMLDVKITKQKLYEQQPYDQLMFREWGCVPLHYNISEFIEGTGKVNEHKAIDLQLEYISISKQVDQFRTMYIMPTGIGLWYTQLTAYMFMFGYRTEYIPNFWHIKYFSGFDRVPEDIVEAVGKATMLQVYNILGNILFPVGIASFSKSIDGLSQSTGTTASATNALFGASINQFEDELKVEIPQLKAKYRGIPALRL